MEWKELEEKYGAKKKTSRKILLSIVLLTIVIVSIGIYYIYFFKGISFYCSLSAEQKKMFEDCEREMMEMSDIKQICYEGAMATGVSVNICNQIVAKLQRSEFKDVITNLCYERVAEKTREVSICDCFKPIKAKELQYFSQAVSKDFCISRVNITIKRFEVDIMKCEQKNTTKEKDACFRSMAQSYADISLCDKISNADEKYRCTAFIEKDVSICEKIQDLDTKDFCFIDLAKLLNQPSICDKIQTTIIQDHDVTYRGGMKELCLRQF